MLADCLTKRGVNADKLMKVIKEGRMPRRERGGHKELKEDKE